MGAAGLRRAENHVTRGNGLFALFGQHHAAAADDVENFLVAFMIMIGEIGLARRQAIEGDAAVMIVGFAHHREIVEFVVIPELPVNRRQFGHARQQQFIVSHLDAPFHGGGPPCSIAKDCGFAEFVRRPGWKAEQIQRCRIL
ncbi:hypothetical protein SDC9_207171 [bioreactor metagenome]|uniref:Uncharacterized protein n=1 Tax=bioreactor metagenome TaxID=1076179 RepID=A0A645J8H6_9ZZZZ